MGRRLRIDFVGAWLHVMIRALSKRPLFEGSADVRDFLACLAAAVRRGEIEVHAFAFLTTHVHLLVRSPRGEVSVALKRVLSEYVRKYNRRRERDGPLLRSRFRSKVIRTDRHWMAVVRYIDNNPADAGLAKAACALALSSRLHYAKRRGPPWLSRGRIEATVGGYSGGKPYDPADYARVFGGPIAPELAAHVESALLRGDRANPFADLLDAASPPAREWLERNAVLADGRRGGPLLATATLVQAVVGEARRECPDWRLRTPRRILDGWQVVEVALLRAMSGESQETVAHRTRLPRSSVRGLCSLHASLRDQDRDYANRFAAAAAAVRAAVDASVPLVANPATAPIGE